MKVTRWQVSADTLRLVQGVQIAAKGLTPNSQCQVYLAESSQAPFGKLGPLAILKTNPDGAGIVQAIGPLKTLAAVAGGAHVLAQRFLIVTELKDRAQVVLLQARDASGPR